MKKSVLSLMVIALSLSAAGSLAGENESELNELRAERDVIAERFDSAVRECPSCAGGIRRSFSDTEINAELARIKSDLRQRRTSQLVGDESSGRGVNRAPAAIPVAQDISQKPSDLEKFAIKLTAISKEIRRLESEARADDTRTSSAKYKNLPSFEEQVRSVSRGIASEAR